MEAEEWGHCREGEAVRSDRSTAQSGARTRHVLVTLMAQPLS